MGDAAALLWPARRELPGLNGVLRRGRRDVREHLHAQEQGHHLLPRALRPRHPRCEQGWPGLAALGVLCNDTARPCSAEKQASSRDCLSEPHFPRMLGPPAGVCLARAPPSQKVTHWQGVFLHRTGMLTSLQCAHRAEVAQNNYYVCNVQTVAGGQAVSNTNTYCPGSGPGVCCLPHSCCFADPCVVGNVLQMWCARMP